MQTVTVNLCLLSLYTSMSWGTAFPRRLHVRSAKTQNSLCIHAVWSDSPSEDCLGPSVPTDCRVKTDETADMHSAQANLIFHWAHMQSCHACSKCCAPAY